MTENRTRVSHDIQKKRGYEQSAKVTELSHKTQITTLHHVKIRRVCIIVFIFFIFLVGIVLTHRIAGPLYHIKRKLDQALQGEEIELITLRNGDELQDVADKINELLLQVKNISTK